jgi:hypothetical protein
MSKDARSIVNGGEKKGFFSSTLGAMGINLNWSVVRARMSGIATTGYEWGVMGYTFTRQIGWYVVTTAMITALPLIFEYNREIQVEDMEALQVQDALEKGANPMALAQQGMTSAVDPKVL